MKLTERLEEARSLHGQGRLAEAEAAYRTLLAEAPSDPNALQLLGVVLTQRGDPAGGAEAMRRSLALQPCQPVVYANLGNAQVALEAPEAALESYARALAALPDYAPAHYGRGNALYALGRYAAAEASYRRGAEIAPHFVAAHQRRAQTLSLLNQHDAALDVCRAVLELDPSNVEARFVAGTALAALGELQRALAFFDAAQAGDPAHVPARVGRACVRLDSGRVEEALADLDAALLIAPDYSVAHFLRGRALMQQGRHGAAAAAFRRVHELDPGYEHALGAQLYAALHVCDWSNYVPVTSAIEAGVARGEPAALPFMLFCAADDPELQLRCARQFAVRHRIEVPALWRGERYAHDRLRIAYVSEDFRSHPASYLTVGLFEGHDRRCFETIAISLRAAEPTPFGARVRAAFDRFLDVSGHSEAAIAATMRDLEVDIAIDLMGYTGSRLHSLWARRPAPIHVSYIGYAGTMGTRDVDYLLADRFLVPPGSERYYDEQIVRLPLSYQPNDDRRAIGAPVTRADAGLREDAFVWCGFNNAYKINPPLFDIWMRLLHAVPRSVLWLLPNGIEGEANLRREAALRGVDPERLVFAARAPNPDHLARLALADLCLDTAPVNGMTTTSDALWAGVPVVAHAGRSLVSRMSGSVLSGAGLPELITDNWDDYEALCLALATDRERLAQLRSRVARAKYASALFDTARTRRHVESAYGQMWSRCVRGELPAAFDVEPLGDERTRDAAAASTGEGPPNQRGQAAFPMSRQ
jgi:protein O-GlcNAc transferase